MGSSLRVLRAAVYVGSVFLLGIACSSKSTTPTQSTVDAGVDAGFDAGPPPKVCEATCQGDEDCLFNNQPGFSTLKCRNNSCFGCDSVDDCINLMSGIIFPCQNDTFCKGLKDFGDRGVCVTLGSEGRCALSAGTVGCEQPVAKQVQMKKFGPGDKNDVIVCQADQVACQGNLCRFQCSTDEFCEILNGFGKCNKQTAQCECASDTDCKDASGNVYGGAKCIQNLGRCGCETKADCTGSKAGTECVNNQCSCTDSSSCAAAQVFPKTVAACQPRTGAFEIY